MVKEEVYIYSTPTAQWDVENIPYVPLPLPFQSSSFSFPINLPLPVNISQALPSFQMAKAVYNKGWYFHQLQMSFTASAIIDCTVVKKQLYIPSSLPNHEKIYFQNQSVWRMYI